MKAVANGFIFGRNNYFSDNWNRLDGILVIISLVDSLVRVFAGKKYIDYNFTIKFSLKFHHARKYYEHKQHKQQLILFHLEMLTDLNDFLGKNDRLFRMLRVFRLIRALRPLRVINRAPGLKLVVQTLLSSLKPISNIVIICCAFFLIFGILGVQVNLE